MPTTASSLLRICILLLFPLSIFAQASKDGAETISTTGVVFNRYDAATAITTNTVTVSNITNLAGGAAGANNPYATSALGYGDLIMLIKMQGATINTTNTSAYGTVTAMNNVGVYELAVVRGVTGNTITACGTFTNTFTISSTQRVQVVRIPRITTLTINTGASLTGNAWNGTTGGVVAIEANGNIVVNGSITTSGLGYRGGAVDNNSNLPGTTSFVSTSSLDGGEKGEGIAGYQTDYDALGGRYNRGAPANGGGGGNAHNAGGGGGANGGVLASWSGNGNPDNSIAAWTTAWNLESASFSSSTSSGGGRGGYTYGSSNQDATTTAPGNALWGGDSRQNLGGVGGRPLPHTTTTLFMGGGGGAGDANNSSAGPGGNGGGIIYLLGTGTLSGTGSITANGSNGSNTIGGHNDAPAGAGAGGAIRLNIQGIISGISVSANGGTGGNQLITSDENEGPGGGGGGGFVSVTGTPGITITVTGGANGTTNSNALTEFTPNGATRGGVGSSLNSQSYVAAPGLTCFALPLNFVSITAMMQSDNQVAVAWSAADEVSVAHYDIQVSTNRQQWNTVAQKAALNAAGISRYTATINSVGSLFYVRIQSVDVDGRIQYSSVVPVQVKNQGVAIYLQGSILQIEKLPGGTEGFEIYGSGGQLVKRQKLVAGATNASVDISSLVSGVYYIGFNGVIRSEPMKFVKK